MKLIQKICFVISLLSVALAVPLGVVMIWTEKYDGLIQRLMLSSMVIFLGCLALLVVIQTIVGRRAEETA